MLGPNRGTLRGDALPEGRQARPVAGRGLPRPQDGRRRRARARRRRDRHADRRPRHRAARREPARRVDRRARRPDGPDRRHDRAGRRPRALPDRRGREPVRGLPDPRRGQQRPGVLGKALRGYEPARTRFFEGRSRPAAESRAPRSARSTARTDRYVYIDLGFFDELESLRRLVGPARAGLRARPRVRPPRPEPDGRPRARE